MGMYTELLLKCSIKPGEKLEKLRSHSFENPCIKTERSCMFFSGGSLYHHPKSFFSLRERGYLFTRFDIKNYNSDIETLLEWLSDAVDEQDGQCVGWYWYEEEPVPSLLIMKDGKITINI
jgi:hypothetical protein